MSRQRRVDPPVTVGLLCDPGGFSLECTCSRADGRSVEMTRAMDTGKERRARRVAYQYSFERGKSDRAINAVIKEAEDVTAGPSPLKGDRFVRIDGATKGVAWDLVEQARSVTGLKGYATTSMPSNGPAGVAAYPDLYHQVERSFRMVKLDLRPGRSSPSCATPSPASQPRLRPERSQGIEALRAGYEVRTESAPLAPCPAAASTSQRSHRQGEAATCAG